MADKKEPIYWITVNGAHVPIYEETAKWMPVELRERYSRYIDDHSHDHQLDSDEKTWVEALRHEKYQQQEDQKERQIAASKKQADKLNAEDKAGVVKPWSKAEEKRTQETSKMVDHYLYAGDDGEFMEYYDTEGEVIHSQKLGKEYGTRDSVEAQIMKEHFIYARNWDENDNRVKKGKKVAGSTYYTVDIDGQVLDENVAGYKTEADARHALAIELEFMKKREQAWK